MCINQAIFVNKGKKIHAKNINNVWFLDQIKSLLNNGHGIKRRQIILKDFFYTFDNTSQKNCAFFPNENIGNKNSISCIYLH